MPLLATAQVAGLFDALLAQGPESETTPRWRSSTNSSPA